MYVSQQENECKGVVLDETGETVIGASVLVKGTSNGTITDLDGNFVIQNVKKGDVIVVSYVGYKNVETVWDGTNLRILLKSNAEELDEVVVVGYGVQKKVNLTGAVSSVKGEAFETRPVVDATQGLQGMVPGLNVSNGNSGRPGATGTLSLRGQGNLSGNASPYVLVDGVEMSLSDINPNDIESISVLKDAAACSIYGARAAYGVILVTTKKGQEGKMRANYQGTVGWSTPTVLPDMVNSLDFVKFWNDGVTNAGAGGRAYSAEKIAQLEQYMRDPSSLNPWAELQPGQSLNAAFENSELGLGNTDYFDLHYKNFSFKQSHNLSFSGGNKKAQYYVSAGYYNEDGILRYADMDYTRYTVNANITSELTKWMKLKFNTKYMHSDNRTPFNQGTVNGVSLDGGLSEGFYHSLARFRPTVSPVDPNGHFTELSLIPYLQSGTYTDTQNDRFNFTTGLEFQPVKNWFIFFDYTYKQENMEYEALNVAPYIYEQDGTTLTKVARSELGVSADGQFTRAYSTTRYQSINLYTNYMFSLADKHNFTVMAGYQEENNDFSWMKNSVTGLYSNSNPNVGMGTGDKVVVDTRNGWATRGFFGRINYDYDGRYLVELNGRYDGSSRFAKDSRWGFFPSVSLGWNIHREKFMQKAEGFLSNLKLRVSYGLLGNQANAGLYTFASTMNINNGLGQYIFSDGRHMYTNPPAVVNPNTTWEKVESKNIGLDFGFFDNKLHGNIDVYNKLTTGILYTPDMYMVMGNATAPKANIAEVTNRGVELELGWRDNIGRDFSYSIKGQFSFNKNFVSKYKGKLEKGWNKGHTEYSTNIGDVSTGSTTRVIEGRQINEFYLPNVYNGNGSYFNADGTVNINGGPKDGMIRTENDMQWLQAMQAAGYTFQPYNNIAKNALWYGEYIYADANGDGVYGNSYDSEFQGTSTTPKYNFGIQASANWKDFDFSMTWGGSAGFSIYYYGKARNSSETTYGYAIPDAVADDHYFYDPENPSDPRTNLSSKQPRLVNVSGAQSSASSSLHLEKGNFIKLRNLTLGYTMPKSISKKFYVERLRVYASGENLFAITGFSGMDPEMRVSMGYSTMRQYAFGINLTF